MVEHAARAATELANRFWESLLELEPLLATQLGDERYDDRLPDVSDRGIGERKALFERARGELAGIDRSSLDLDLRTTLDLLHAATERGLEEIELRIDRLFAVIHLFGPSQLLADLASLQRADTPERVDRYVGRLDAVPRYLEAASGVAMDGARIGQTVPRLVVDRTIGQVERLLALGPEESPGMIPAAGASEGDRARVAEVLRRRVWPAYGRFLETLAAYRASARETIAIADIPGGEDVYAAQIRAHTTLDASAERIHRIGLEQLAGIQEERRGIAARLGHPDARAAIEAHDAIGANRAKSREGMLRLVEDQVRRSWEAAPRFFGRLPKENCVVRKVEEFREDDMPGAFYYPPSADGSRPGMYYVNTGQLQERPLHQTATTTFHEANPGHHFQLSIEQEFVDRLPLRRFGAALIGDAFVEGWGLYSERLADEMELFLDDYERLGMLEQQAFRAARLVVDTGIHAMGWDRERAVRQMEETGTPRADCEIEVDRYIANPGQALAYMMGKLEIDRLREETRGREGSSFSLSAFHDRVLALGSLPLPALARELASAG